MTPGLPLPGGFLPVANHLWQSTLIAGIAGLLTLLLRNNRAHARYCVWLAASAKFLVPFSLLMLVGGLVGRHSVIVPARARVPVVIEQVNEPFVAEPFVSKAPPGAQRRTRRMRGPGLFRSWLRCGRLAAVLCCSRGGRDGGEYKLPSARGRRCLWGSAFQRCLRHRSLSLEYSAYSVPCCCYRRALGIAWRQRNYRQFWPMSCVTFAAATIWRR